jgi:hypothetical protein
MREAPVFRGQRHTARTLALQVLLDGRRREGFAQELLDRELGRGDLPAADRRLATQLVYGVLRRRGRRNTSRRGCGTRCTWGRINWRC